MNKLEACLKIFRPQNFLNMSENLKMRKFNSKLKLLLK